MDLPSTSIWTPQTTTSTSGRSASTCIWSAAFSGNQMSSSSQKATNGARATATPALRPPGSPGVWLLARTWIGRSPSATSRERSGSLRSKTTTVSMTPS